MGMSDFPTWFGVGSYGGLACTMLAAGGIAAYALLRRRGSPRQLARAVLVCLFAGAFMLASVWWNQNRLELYGPSLAEHEILFWLCWTVCAGWLIPLGMLLGYLLLAEPQPAAQAQASSRFPQTLTALDDPARFREPLGAGIAWGRLVPLFGVDAGDDLSAGHESQEGRPLPLTRQMTLLGREIDCDIVIDDQRTSRHHAEIHWDHGRAQVVDRGSMNSTLVNRQTVRGPTPLVDGDILELGAQRYRFEFVPAANAGHELPPEPLDPLEQSQPEIETRKVPGTNTARPNVPVPLVLTGLSVGVAGLTWIVDQPIMTIGRDRERPICIPDESVSRLHAQIVRQQVGYFVSDLHSSNGTFLNGDLLIAPSLLSPGDILRVGAIELRCDASLLESPSQTTIPLDESARIAQTA
jgi:pSer/pThr/pTyr-binding forkhead associated (FHA) protein